MRVIPLGFPLDAYTDIPAGRGLRPDLGARLTAALEAEGCAGAMVYGSNFGTGRAMADALGERFVFLANRETVCDALPDGVDCLVAGVAPGHYEAMLHTLRTHYGHRDLPLFLPFAATGEEEASEPGASRPEPGVACILETQPRSGTHYVINSLMAALGLEFAAVAGPGAVQAKYFTHGVFLRHGVAFHDVPHAASARYVVKSHFFDPVRSPELRREAFMVHVFAYPFDTYYSWGHLMHAQGAKYGDYRLRADSPEWAALKDRVYGNVRWLSYAAERAWLRYEDFGLAPERAAGIFQAGLGLDAPPAMLPFRPSPSRTYHADGLEARFDPEVLDVLRREFEVPLRRFYPEKLAALGMEET